MSLSYQIFDTNQPLQISTQRLKEAMERKNIDIKTLADQMSISPQYLGRLISGRQDLGNAKVRVLVELSQVLNVSTDYLLGLDVLRVADAAMRAKRIVMLELENFGD